MIQIDSTVAFEELVKATELVVVDFWAEWCRPCVAYGPIFADAATNNPTATFVKVNVDVVPELAGQYSIQSIPSTLIFRDGVVSARYIGIVPDLDERVKLFSKGV